MISDIHEDPRIIVPTLEALQMEGVDKLIVNGDIGGNYGSLEKSQQYTAFILDKIANSGLEAFVQPGSHETLLGYGPVIEHFADKHSNIVDTIKNPKVEFGDHDLVFLPGSDFLCGGEYQIGSNEEIPSGRYVVLGENKFGPFNELTEYVDALNSRVAKGAFQYFNMNDLRKLVTNPDKTVMVCHVPRKFYNPDTCVDMAEFGITENGFREYFVIDEDGKQGLVIENSEDDHYAFLDELKNRKLRIKDIRPVHNGSVMPLPSAIKHREMGANVDLRKENRGNEDLKNLYEEIGVKKAVSGHFHESSHRAHDSDCNKIMQGEFVDELFWNSGHLDRGYFGILTVDEDKVSYRNLNLKDFLVDLSKSAF